MIHGRKCEKCDGLNVIALLFIGSLNVQKSPRLEAVIKGVIRRRWMP